MSDARTAAVHAVRAALAGEAFASDQLRTGADGLSTRDTGLALEIAQGTLRHVITIEHVLSQVATYEPRRTNAMLRAILCTAAYQVVWLERVPPFAAVDQAVELAQRLVRGKAPGMVNAILRRLTGAIRERRIPWTRLNAAQIRVDWMNACTFDQSVLPPAEHDLVQHLAYATGQPPARFAAHVERWGLERAESLSWASQSRPVTVIQRNALRTSATAFAETIHSVTNSAGITGDTAFLPTSASIVDSHAFRTGELYIQDVTANTAARAVAPQPGERVLDLCAAPGGKTITLALLMNDEGSILACDTDAQRLRRVDENVQRLGLTCVQTRVITPGEDLSHLPNAPFDAALIDVPCSNTGVIARRPEARLGLTLKKLASLAEVQRSLIDGAARSVRSGGRLVYSTCSIEDEENQAIVATFLNEHPQWTLTDEQTALPTWGPQLANWRDGGYYAVLTRAPA